MTHEQDHAITTLPSLSPTPAPPTAPHVAVPATQPLVSPAPHVPAPAVPTLPTVPAAVAPAPVIPTLPSVAAPVTAPVEQAHAPAPAPAPATPTQSTTQSTTPGTTPGSSPRSGPKRFFAVIGLVALVGAAGYLVYDDYIATPTSATEAERSTEQPSAQPASDPDSERRDGVGGILDDSSAAVEAINDNSQEAELLGELGLDPTGAPAPKAYTFSWLDLPNSADTVTVDVATGNFEVTNAGGRLRRVGGIFFTQNPNDGTWSQTGELDVERVGMTAPITTDDVIPAPIMAFVVATEVLDDGSTRFVVDRHRLAAEAPELLAAWFGPWGLGDGLVMPDVEPAGDVVDIVMTADAAGIVQRVTMSTTAQLGQVQYELLTTATQAVTIDAPVTQD